MLPYDDIKSRDHMNIQFWQTKYKEDHTPWDIGQVAPAFAKYISELEPKKQIHQVLKVCVLGCGRGHDAFYFADKGFETYGFDFAKDAIDFCNKVKGKRGLKTIYFHQKDFFELVKDKTWNGFFDYVIEHTSFCAINPKKRKEYIDLISYLLKPKGRLIGLFFIRPKELGGPPYGISPEKLRTLFNKGFKEIIKLYCEKCLHETTLEGEEYFGVFEKR